MGDDDHVVSPVKAARVLPGREQLLLEVLLDIRDAVSAKPAEPARSGPDPITALQTFSKIIKR